MPCRAVPCRAVPRRAVPCRAVSQCGLFAAGVGGGERARSASRLRVVAADRPADFVTHPIRRDPV